MTENPISKATFEKPSIKSAWNNCIKHFPAFAVAWTLCFIGYLAWTLVFYLFLYSGLIVDLVQAGNEEPQGVFTGLGMIIGFLGGFPFWLVCSALLSMIYAIPAIYYNQDSERVTAEIAFKELYKRRFRYIFAGIVHTVLMLIGYLFCFLPGLIVACIGPIYINKIFLTDQSIFEALGNSFKVVFRSKNWFSFLLVSVVGGLIVTISTVFTCNIAYFVTFPMYAFYIQNYAYYKGILIKSK